MTPMTIQSSMANTADLVADERPEVGRALWAASESVTAASRRRRAPSWAR
jgi:hypothetical protein